MNDNVFSRMKWTCEPIEQINRREIILREKKNNLTYFAAPIINPRTIINIIIFENIK